MASGRCDLALFRHQTRGAASWWLLEGIVEQAEGWAPPHAGLPAPHAGPAFPAWVAILPYEAGRSLVESAGGVAADSRPPTSCTAARWIRFARGVEFGADGRSRLICAEHEMRAWKETVQRGLLAGFNPTLVGTCRASDTLAAHRARVLQAKAHIARGDIYEVNLAQRFEVALRTGGALQAFARMLSISDAAYASLIQLGTMTVVSSSPELFLQTQGNRVWTLPIKGSRPRGEDAVQDAARVRELDADPKERAELAMVIDVERNDLSRVCDPHSIRTSVPHVVTHRSIHHRQARVSGTLRDGVSVEDLLRATFPSGSITGAPKRRAMEIIAALEPFRRGVYTGALGYLSSDGALRLSMAIRTLVLQEGEGEYMSGGGIVEHSDPDRECEEVHWKAVQVQRMFDG